MTLLTGNRETMIDPVNKPPYRNYFCPDLPLYWPFWVGGDEDFCFNCGQPFHKLEELRISTMLEF